MAFGIEPHCNACGRCAAICPVWAISEWADGWHIHPELCTECVGFADAPVCIGVCPVNAISHAPWQPQKRIPRPTNQTHEGLSL